MSIIRSLLSQKLARYKLPKTIVFLQELSRNAMGKVKKDVLREDFLRLDGVSN